MTGILPDSSLSCLVDNEHVHVYAQTVNGVLVECRGSMKTRRNILKYTFDGQYPVKNRYYDQDELDDDAPKLFTPLASTMFQGRKVSLTQPNHPHLVFPFSILL